MGKRELLLIIAFVAAGVIVYQATAPPPPPGARGFSVSGLIDKLRREVRGTRASAEIRRSSTHPVGPGVTELRITEGFGDVTITGEARDDIALEMRIVSNGADEAEARRWAEATEVRVDTTANSIALSALYTRDGRQQGYFTLKVPARLAVRLDQASRRATITNIASLEMLSARGDTTIKQIPGRVALSHAGGGLVVEDVGALKLTARRSEATVTAIRGDLSVDLQNSEVSASEIGGPISVEARASELTFDKLEEARGPTRINIVGGSIALRGVASEVRVDGRNTEVDVEMARPAPVTVYNEGDEPVDVTPPSGGYTLDALATSARISIPNGILSVTEVDDEQRASGAVNGGGPAITLRANRGHINIRTK